jgi:putative two-component system response regulator
MGFVSTENLEAFLRSTGGVCKPEIKVALGRLSAEMKERGSNASPTSIQFFASAVSALGRIRGSAHSQVRLTCLWESFLFFFANGCGTNALEAVRQVEHLANQTRAKLWMRKAAVAYGMIYADLGRISESVVNYARALQIAQETNETSGVCSTLVNLGGALNYGGLYREAIPCLERAAALSESDPELHYFAPPALCNLAQSHLYLGEYEQGMAAISSSLAKSLEPHDTFSICSRVIREFTFVQLAIELGKLNVARSHAAICIRYARSSGTVRGNFLAEIVAGICDIHGGDVDRGLKNLAGALESPASETNSYRAEALIALVRAYDEVGRPELALRHMNELLAQIRSMREKGFETLLSMPSSTGSALVSERRDLQSLNLMEATLRAKVEEREKDASRIEMLERLAVTADLKEESSGEHGYRVGRLSALLAEELNWSRDACYAIDLAARVHDIGKIGIPDRILLNSETLKEAERHFMSTHTVIGAELLAKSNIPQLRVAEEIARCHHEWWDGTGYPAKLAGKRIPLHARIVALADVFDALTHGRPFANPWPMDKALEEIKSRRGTQFDPDLADIFIELIQRLRIEHEDLDEYLGKAGRNSPFLQARNKIRLMLAEETENEKKATVAGNETRH